MAMVLSEKVVCKEQHHTIPVMEPTDGKCVENKLNEYQDYLAECSTHYIGCPLNLDCHHHVALSQFLKFPLNNIGDPFKESDHDLHSKKFEVGVLDWFAQLWGIEKDEYWGYVTNGGTEGNLHGLLLGRELLPDGILYSSKDSHYSIFKAARLYRMNCVKIETLETGEIDCTDLGNKLLHNKDKPAIVNVTIGTTFKGAIDNVDLVIQTLRDCGFSDNQFYIHYDAAISGFIVPFLKQAPMYIFKKPIGSLSISGHKFLGSPMPCGAFITRKKHINIFSENVEYLITLDTTITGSRNGHSPIFMWYSLSVKGYRGFEQAVKNCMSNARYLRDSLRNAGISTMLNERSIIVIFERPLDPEFVRFWQLQCQRNMAHAVIMPHVTTEMLDHFLYDLIQKRKSWYQFGQRQHPCLAEDMGTFNCLCSVHGKGN